MHQLLIRKFIHSWACCLDHLVDKFQKCNALETSEGSDASLPWSKLSQQIRDRITTFIRHRRPGKAVYVASGVLRESLALHNAVVVVDSTMAGMCDASRDCDVTPSIARGFARLALRLIGPFHALREWSTCRWPWRVSSTTGVGLRHSDYVIKSFGDRYVSNGDLPESFVEQNSTD